MDIPGSQVAMAEDSLSDLPTSLERIFFSSVKQDFLSDFCLNMLKKKTWIHSPTCRTPVATFI